MRVATRRRPQFPKIIFKREHINELIHSRALEEREKLIPVHNASAKDRSWTTDYWTSKAGHEIMAVTSHGFTGNFVPQPMFIAGRYSPEAHTGILTLSVARLELILFEVTKFRKTWRLCRRFGVATYNLSV